MEVEIQEAYQFQTQYLFGESFMVSPIVAPVDNVTQIAQKDVWVPPGDWIDFYSGSLYSVSKF